ncbi:MAG TPA: hydrogen peroxide-dependent heme synthase [Candidatus Binataceae bacterium]|nr:hydrogen peroxide-dependent heme synthase [Candidatus Binataceae bacterium]
MNAHRPPEEQKFPADFPAAPLTLEGFSVLHQMFRVRRQAWRALDGARRLEAVEEAARTFAALGRREDGETALYSGLGHKGDLIVLHFRRSFDELNEAQLALAGLALSDFLEPTTSYLSVIEIGLYEATVALHKQLAEKQVRPRSPEWQRAIEEELASQRSKLNARIYPKIPERRYLCFYPMDKKREGADNWYRLPIDERRRLMHDHGLVGRRFAGEVTQIISGSIGFDDWEWGVDLFADDPLVFKKLVYEMRFDEASAGYAKFGPFYVGIRVAPDDLAKILATNGGPR